MWPTFLVPAQSDRGQDVLVALGHPGGQRDAMAAMAATVHLSTMTGDTMVISIYSKTMAIY